MSSFNKGKAHSFKRPPKFFKASSSQLENQAKVRVGKQSKQGPKKGMATPGRKTQIKR